MVKIKGKIWQTGNGWVISVPKALLDAEVLKKDKVYQFELCDEKSADGGSLSRKLSDFFGKASGRIENKLQRLKSPSYILH